jgi:hypothetical protein
MLCVLSMFSYEKSGNEKFASRLVTWTFQERGILRARDVQHHRVGEKTAPYSYTIKDDIVSHVMKIQLIKFRNTLFTLKNGMERNGCLSLLMMFS